MPEPLTTTCCIVGGGPAGVMLGYLLARSGVDVIVLEKHADFFRDFRGDTVHPSTLEVLHELGLLDEFLQLPHDELQRITLDFAGHFVTMGDFTHLPTTCKFIALVPQWDFLNFFARHGARFAGFHLMMQAEATGIIERNGTVAGVRVKTQAGEVEIRATLTIGADGRNSTIRNAARFEVEDIGAPMDVLWFRLNRRPDETAPSLGHVRNGRIFVTIPRGTYFQCAFVIPKGSGDALKAQGIEGLREGIVATAPEMADRVGELQSWDAVSLLSVRVDRLKHWYRSGLLFVGDAAHAMSPIGGVGINLAIQDAVAAANELAGPLLRGTLATSNFARFQRRRFLPTVLTQGVQVLLQRNVIGKVFASGQTSDGLPLALTLLQRFPWLQRIPARLFGMGFRPEHVHTRELA
jgi:2-polyprenyl-6-methoxyphenol hydroxylase-like FAD-dependent oxidoreductase